MNRKIYPSNITEDGKKFLDAHSRLWQPGDDEKQVLQLPNLLKKLQRGKSNEQEIKDIE